MDFVSQPSRAVVAFCDINHIPYDLVDMKIMRGGHKTEEFKKINPNQQIPVIQEEDGFVVWDSHAILRYLKEKHECPDHWYPTDLRKRAAVDQYLEWSHQNLRMGCTFWFIMKVFPEYKGYYPKEEEINTRERERSKQMQT